MLASVTDFNIEYVLCEEPCTDPYARFCGQTEAAASSDPIPGGCGNGVKARLLGHRQTKGTETDKSNLMLPRHISTLPK